MDTTAAPILELGVVLLLAAAAGWAARRVGLGQIGEFSFVLASVGLAAGAISTEVYAAVLASVAITIVASTVLVRLVRGDRSLSATPVAG